MRWCRVFASIPAVNRYISATDYAQMRPRRVHPQPGTLAPTGRLLVRRAARLLGPISSRWWPARLPPLSGRRLAGSADAYSAAMDRIKAAEEAGLMFSRERINVQWTLADGLPARTRRLDFRIAETDDHVLDILAQVSDGSLDADDRRELARGGPARAAKATLDAVAGMPGGRSRWRIALDEDGQLIGSCCPRATRHPQPSDISVWSRNNAGSVTPTISSLKRSTCSRPMVKPRSTMPPTWTTSLWPPRSCDAATGRQDDASS